MWGLVVSLTSGLHWRAECFARAFPDRVSHGAGFVLAKSAAGEETMYATWMGGNDYRNASPMYGAYPRLYLDGAMSLFPDLATGGRVLHLFSGSLTAEQVRAAWIASGNSRSGTIDPIQIRFDNALHPAARAAKPELVGNAEELERVLALAAPSNLHDIVKADVVFADPPYRLPDQRRYWRESMMAIDELGAVCGVCHEPVSMHEPRYLKSTHEGVLVRGVTRDVTLHEYSHPRYVRFKPLNKKLVIQQAAAVLTPEGFLVWLDEIRPPYDNTRWIFRGGMALLRSTNHRVRYATLLERRA